MGAPSALACEQPRWWRCRRRRRVRALPGDAGPDPRLGCEREAGAHRRMGWQRRIGGSRKWRWAGHVDAAASVDAEEGEEEEEEEEEVGVHDDVRLILTDRTHLEACGAPLPPLASPSSHPPSARRSRRRAAAGAVCSGMFASPRHGATPPISIEVVAPSDWLSDVAQLPEAAAAVGRGSGILLHARYATREACRVEDGDPRRASRRRCRGHAERPADRLSTSSASSARATTWRLRRRCSSRSARRAARTRARAPDSLLRVDERAAGRP